MRQSNEDGRLVDVLKHIDSLGYATRDQIGVRCDGLIKAGYIEKIWINNYALTEAGKERMGKRK